MIVIRLSIYIYRDSKKIFNQASMNLREWTSNDNLFNINIPEEDRIKENNISILGHCWNNESDILSIPIINKESNNIYLNALLALLIRLI